MGEVPSAGLALALSALYLHLSLPEDEEVLAMISADCAAAADYMTEVRAEVAARPRIGEVSKGWLRKRARQAVAMHRRCEGCDCQCVVPEAL